MDLTTKQQQLAQNLQQAKQQIDHWTRQACALEGALAVLNDLNAEEAAIPKATAVGLGLAPEPTPTDRAARRRAKAGR